jgi:pimeloyl-ACP methyl ester carboxylesterase
MLFSACRVFQRMMSSTPTSHFITLPNRPVVQENGEITQGPLKLHYWQWQGHQPTVLICHGGSFHGRCYDRIVNEALSGFHVIALDYRGHGRSQRHPSPYKLPWFGEDVFHFIESLDLSKNNLLGIGHSGGGYTLTLAAAIAPKRLFQGLLLLDPSIFSPSIYGMGDKVSTNTDGVARRQSQWSSVEDMISYMEKRKAFSEWPKDIIRDYCSYALDDNFQLVCTPERELSIYVASMKSEANIYPIIKESKFIHDIPTHIVRSARGPTAGKFEAPPTAPDLVKSFKKGRDTQLKDSKHLFPMEQPQLTADIVKEFIAEHKNLRSHL